VVSPVSRGSCGDPGEESVEVVAVEAPVEWSGGVVVARLECGEPLGEDFNVGKVIWCQQFSLHD
jgi:hypothetical protein